jgi:glycosyltransferase involved in cell wall biosynthesis
VLSVFYDGCIFDRQPRGGVSVVFKELFKRVAVAPGVRCFCTVPWGTRLDNTYGLRRLPVPEIPSDRLRAGWWQFCNDVYCTLIQPDVFHSTYYTPPCRFSKAKTVLTIHDMIYELFPREFSSVWDRQFVAFKRTLARDADAIVCISKSTRADVLRFYPNLDPSKLHVVYLGVSESFLSPVTAEQKDKVRQQCRLTRPYVLYVGKLDSPYKNVDVLLDVYAGDPVLHDQFDLVLVHSDRGSDQQVATMRRLGDRVKQYSGVSEAQLKLFYSCCSVFVYPSKHEGFGLPILEAMACGVPVITADVSSMPEVAGGAALLFQPESRDGLRRCLLSLLDDDGLRTTLVNKGFGNLSRFSWDSSARQLGQIYSQLCSRSQRDASGRGSCS